MSVSDEAGGTPKPKPDWKLIRSQYEQGDISQRKLAVVFQVPYGTLFKRAMREKWKQRKALTNGGVNAIQAAMSHEMESAIKSVALAEAARFRDEMQPWIEEKRQEITKRGYKVYERGIGRIERLYDETEPVDAKKESEAARAVETLVRVGRTSLGMSDGSSAGGNLALNILTNQAAITVSH